MISGRRRMGVAILLSLYSLAAVVALPFTVIIALVSVMIGDSGCRSGWGDLFVITAYAFPIVLVCAVFSGWFAFNRRRDGRSYLWLVVPLFVPLILMASMQLHDLKC